MIHAVTPALRLQPTPDERARQTFVSQLRAHLLDPLAATMKARFQAEVAPSLPAGAGPREVHEAMRGHPVFRLYSAARVTAQDMVWAAVRPMVERGQVELARRFHELATRRPAGGTLRLNSDLRLPDNVTAVDVHRMPGNYHLDRGADDLAAGALYENGLAVFAAGLMGETLDDIGRSVTCWLKRRHPEFAPAVVLDLGCAVGHQTLPWKLAYPEARVMGLDVAAAGLRYAHARAEAIGVELHFLQADARRVPLPDGSVDLVFSAMFLHELPVADVRAVFAEAFRLLRPGGLMLHYELPPNRLLDAYDGFYLDWDNDYNSEPFYRAYRDLDPLAETQAAGFAAPFEASIPSLGWHGEAAVAEAARAQGAEASDRLGRLSQGIHWYVFGGWR